jgi:glycosyltransferase involved in cell wall biosynthesis
MGAKTAPTRVCRIVTQASAKGLYGGPYDTARRQARLVALSGAEVALVAGHLPDDAPREEVVSGLRYTFEAVQRLFGKRPATLVSSAIARAMWREIGSADVVHISFARELVPLTAAVMCLVRRKRWVAQTHGMMTSRTSVAHSVVDHLVLPILRRADVIIALTDHERTELSRLGRFGSSQFAVLGNPLPEHLSSTDREMVDSKPLVVFIARLHPRKRVADFVDAARHSETQSWAETYRVIGPDGGDLPHVTLAAQELNNLEYGGAVSSEEVLQELSKASVFVLCSDREPWGNVLVSAIALGVPVVVSESAALASDIEEAGAGIVVRDENPEDIARAAHEIIADPVLAESMSQNAKRHAQEAFSNSSQTAAIRRIYNNLLP